MLFYCIPNLSFLTSPDKVNGLQGFNFSWTEVLHVQSEKTENSSFNFDIFEVIVNVQENNSIYVLIHVYALMLRFVKSM